MLSFFMTLPLKTKTLTYEIPSHNFSVRLQGTIYMYLCARKVSKFQGKVCTIRYNDLRSLYFNHHDFQARRQEFPEGGTRSEVLLRQAQGPQKLWGIWSKILKSSNFQALHSENFRKVLFFKTDYMIFTKFYTNLGIN